MASTTQLIAYASPLVIHGGETVALHISSNGPKTCAVQILRMICGDPDPNGPGQQFVTMPWGKEDDIAVDFQPVNAGSYGVVEHPLPLAEGQSFSLQVLIWPTAPAAGAQTILSWCDPALNGGFSLAISKGGFLRFSLAQKNDAPVHSTLTTALLKRRWYRVDVSVDMALAQLRLAATMLAPVAGLAEREETLTAISAWPAPQPGTAHGVSSRRNTELLFAARAQTVQNGRLFTAQHYNGKLEAPRLFAASGHKKLLAAWDFSQQIESAQIIDSGPYQLNGHTVNLPMRAATGAGWNGSTEHWRHAPEQYAAIHFHDDDLYDCAWQSSVSFSVPPDARSGYYVARMSAAGVESYAPFFVSARTDAPQARIVLIAPTATYLSYANTHIKFDSLNTENLYEALMPLSEDELYLNEHRELGLSHYDTHADDSGVVYVSSLRPMLNLRPGLYTFNYLNDTHILAWLETQGFAYDVITDEDLHRDGVAALSPYSVVLTASHPEYYSTAMWEALNGYQNNGGRHMYLGGNGFYWRIGYSPQFPAAIENRRGIAGVRTWEGEPGEHYLSFTGEPGGLWRSCGRAPQALVGVGFCATLFVKSTWYRRTSASYRPEYAFIFAGVEGEIIGDFGYRGNGAAGMEIDRWDADLGSPPGSVVLASTEDIGTGGLLSGEEYITTTRALDGAQNAKVRADMVYFNTPNGGAVWSSGSIAWATSLCWNRGDNSVSRVTANVLRRFLDPAPLD